ncbi:DEAD/DEAH box helicase [Undibacterium luofuense]|jgi:superfamily II DNA/RNA helicase|uniref:DEAD/DEAH box helicase n=1 Tax=Undibacterium luofuense TaxID=2828733 RepID=A0A941DNQ6_9BURK|nr:DEAD/DEAH box helicase [Undibacterium luofuense]MBR7784188.1 DEAD/DEAH box helicase [Undibacterium luofuense]
MSFEALGLHANIIRALTDAGYTQPTPVQQQAIPAAIEGRDLMVSSQTGSGKTAAFMLPALHKLATAEVAPAPRTPNQERQAARARGDRPRFTAAKPKMLVLTPTRELALQVTTATDKYSAHTRRLRAVSILGGMPYPKQMQLLSRNPEILVATPGRLIDHMESGKIDFSELQMLVLDEADRMLDMGFIDDIEKIVAATPTTRQTMLFSATLDGVVGNMAKRITNEPLIIQIASSATKHENIEQRVHYVDDLLHKNRMLDHLLRDTAIDQAVVFTATKRDADGIADRLNIAGFAAAALHGDMHQGARNRTLSAMRNGQVRVLVATDVAARGIDVPGITHVFNYDLPKFAEDYVHRIGRTGRAGRKGIAVSLVNHAESLHVRRIERFTKQTIPVDVIEGYEPQRAPAAARGNRKPGWKPGEGRGKPRSGSSSGGRSGQRSFGAGAGAGNGSSYGGQRSFGAGAGAAAAGNGGQRGFGGGQERSERGERAGYGQRREGGSSFGGQRREGGSAYGQRREGGNGGYGQRRDSQRRFSGE